MDTKEILADLRTELSRINQAIAALELLDAAGNHATRPATAAPVAAPKRLSRRRMSAAVRKRLSALAKARWAARRKKVPTAKKAVPARHMSAAARKRLSELAKKRWAKQKKQGKTTL